MPLQDNVNRIIQEKAKQAIPRLKSEMEVLGIQHKSDDIKLDKSLKTSTSRTNGFICRIRFRFKKSGIYVHKGVGRGTNASQVGSTNRRPKEWFNPVIEKLADELAEELLDEYEEAAYKIIFENYKIR